MHIELIGKCTLKVSLTPLDLRVFNVSYNTIDENNISTRRLILHILDEAYRLKAIDLSNSRLYIEVFPCRSGGCMMYLSNSSGTEITNADDAGELIEIMFFCRDIDELISCACELKERLGEHIKTSCLYCSDTEYRLMIGIKEPFEITGTPNGARPSDTEKTEAAIRAAFTREHCCQLIGSEAVEALCELKE